MSLKNSVLESLEKFENSLPDKQFDRLKKMRGLFEKMVEQGLVKRPTYNLMPISTIFKLKK